MSTAIKQTYPWLTSTYESFLNMLKQARLPHALLIDGLEGLGALPLATEMIKKILCHQLRTESEGKAKVKGKGKGESDDHCTCQSCHLIEQGQHPDWVILEPQGKSNIISVSQIVDLRETFYETPMLGQHKVIFITLAEAMNLNAVNALLKMIEEPPLGLYFILLTCQPSQLIPTLISRCQCLDARPDPEVLKAWLIERLPDSPMSVDQCLSLASDCQKVAKESNMDIDMDLINAQLNFIRMLVSRETTFNELIACTKKVELKSLLLWVCRLLKDLILLKFDPSIDDRHLAYVDLKLKLTEVQAVLSLRPMFALLDHCVQTQQLLNQKIHLNSELTKEALMLKFQGQWS